MESEEEIWAGDLFDRRKEAEDVIGYLQSVAGRPAIREDGHAHVLAVDTEYGQGKTFFLRRLARHMRKSHAVAFVDAWADDLEDEPMVALAATLDQALQPWVDTSDDLRKGLIEFRSKAGRVAKIVAIGLAKRAAGFLITQSGADALGDELAKATEINKDIRKDALKYAGSKAIDDIAEAFSSQDVNSMEARIARFHEGQAAIRDMKSGLSKIVDSLEKLGMKLPITIIIDELDRCRPTYAIKVLEEIKHLFDVPGVAFVLGLHGDQLAHSVTAAYGTKFNGKAYLRRFFNRRYVLKPVELTPLVSKLLVDLSIPANRFQYPDGRPSGGHGQPGQIALPNFISSYMRAYGLSARDTFELMEMLETSAALTAPHPLLLAYLLPLIIAHVSGSSTPLPEIVSPQKWKFVQYSRGVSGGQWIETDIGKMAENYRRYALLDDRALSDAVNSVQASPVEDAIARIRFSNIARDSYAQPERYDELLRTVERFKSD